MAFLCFGCAKERRRIKDRDKKRQLRLDPEFRESARLYARGLRATPEGRALINARKRADYYGNHEVVKAHRRLQYQVNPEKHKQSTKAWRLENKERVQELNRMRRAQHLGQLGNVSRNIKGNLRAAQGNKCAFCKAKLQKGRRVHLDHIIPISKGGLHDNSNLQVLCQNCNLRKKDKDPIKFAQENGRLL